jgi:hypothetical protein
MHPFGFSAVSHERAGDYRFVFAAMNKGLGQLQLNLLPNSVSLMADAAQAIANGYV